MRKTAKRRSVSKLMSKSVNVFNGEKSLDDATFLESPLEADICYHLEFDCNVISPARNINFSHFSLIFEYGKGDYLYQPLF
jgi:hypothetical protein